MDYLHYYYELVAELSSSVELEALLDMQRRSCPRSPGKLLQKIENYHNLSDTKKTGM